MGYCLNGHKELDTTECLSVHLSLYLQQKYFVQLLMRSEDFPPFLSFLDNIDCSGSSAGLKIYLKSISH